MPASGRLVQSVSFSKGAGFAGQMDYMQRNFEKRINPSKLLENAQSVIIVGLNYNRTEKVRCNRTLHGQIASYACYEDYHTFIKEQLHNLADFINIRTKRGLQFKICVDSVPLAERTLAVKTGIGFIGKNQMVINPELGCKIFLGEIITNLKLEYDEPISSRVRCIAHDESTLCSTCDKCIKACPTGALRKDGLFDASKCINYLTIESKGEIPNELASKIGNKLFGCEDCINVCPYQENAPACKNKKFKVYPERAQINLEDILQLKEESFKTKFHDSPIRRTGLEMLKRNARICLGNLNSSLGFVKRTSS